MGELDWVELFDKISSPAPEEKGQVSSSAAAEGIVSLEDSPKEDEKTDEQLQADFEIEAQEFEAEGTLKTDIPLYDFQQEAVKHITTHIPPHARGPICLLADEQGMGKTRQLIAAAVELDQFPCVALMPANLVKKWIEDFNNLAPQLSVKVARRLDEDSWWDGADVVFVSYSNATPIDDAILPPKDFFKCYLADEAHFLKNPAARRTAYAYGIRRRSLYAACFLATGTPLYSRPSDLITQLEILGQLQVLGGAGIFRKWFVRPYQGGEVAKNGDVLHEILRKYCNLVRRTKDGRLTPKTRSLIPVTFPREVVEEYRQLEAEARWLRRNKQMYLGAVTRMRQCLSTAKIEWVATWIADFLRDHPGRSLLAFGFFVETLEQLARRFPDAAVYYGKTPKQKKEEIRKDFQAGKYRLFLGNFVSAGVGLDLFAAADVVFFDLPWTASELFQAEDRVHRFGQTRPVTVHIPYFEGTRDERQIRAIVRRAKDAKLVVDGQVWTPESFLEASRGADGDMLGS